MKTVIAFVEVIFLVVHYQIFLGNFSKRQYEEKPYEKIYGIKRSGSLPYSFYRWFNLPPVDGDGDGYDHTVDCND